MVRSGVHPRKVVFFSYTQCTWHVYMCLFNTGWFTKHAYCLSLFSLFHSAFIQNLIFGIFNYTQRLYFKITEIFFLQLRWGVYSCINYLWSMQFCLYPKTLMIREARRHMSPGSPTDGDYKKNNLHFNTYWLSRLS